MVYYVDTTNTPHYFVVSDEDEYIPGAKYYRIKKNEYQLNEHNIDGMWKSIRINTNNEHNYTDSETGRTIILKYCSDPDIKTKIFS